MKCRAGGYLTYFAGAGAPTEYGVTTLTCPQDGLATGFEVVAYNYGFQSVKVRVKISARHAMQAWK